MFHVTWACCTFGLIRAHVFGIAPAVKGLWSKPPAMSGAAQEELQNELAQAGRRMEEQRAITHSQIYAAQQRLWFEARNKRGPPSTTLSAATTPQEDVPMEEATGSGGTQPEGKTPSLFQPVPIATEAAWTMTASQAGVDINNPVAIQNYMNEKVTTRKDILKTVRDYHVGVIRPEVFHLIAQVESVIGNLNDLILKTQENLNWLASDNRASQKRESGMMVVLTGFDPGMAPQDRLEMINWMLGQVEDIKQFLFHRQYNATDSCKYYYLSVLQTDPSTPPAGDSKWSTVTTLLFKAWDLRKSFMTVFGGSKGTPLWQGDAPVKGFHIKCTPSSPQFQRKLELPLRVILYMLNKYAELQGKTPEPLLILWRTLTIMAPTSVTDFDAQAKAMARMMYYEEQGMFKGRLEVTNALADIIRSKPPDGVEEATLFDYCWNYVAFGIQAQMDAAEKQIFQEATQKAQGSSKGLQLGKGRVHWSSPFIYSCNFNPFPIPMQMEVVEEVSYSWDEYCDKCSHPEKKCGNYATGTFCGAPPTATTPQVSQAAPAGGRGKGNR